MFFLICLVDGKVEKVLKTCFYENTSRKQMEQYNRLDN